MMRESFWKKDWFVGLLVSLVFVLASQAPLLQSLENKAYDLGVLATEHTPSDRIAIIAIDEQSVAKLGRWPWPRGIHAKMLDILATGHPKEIGYTVFFSETQTDPGMQYIQGISRWLDTSTLKDTPDPDQQADLGKIKALLQDASHDLDNDQKLGDGILNAKNVLLPILFERGEPLGNPGRAMPDYVTREAIPNVRDPDGLQDFPLPAMGVLAPIPSFGEKVAALGHLNNDPDRDGAIRAEPLVISYYNRYFPSLSLMLVAKSLNLGPQDIHIDLGHGVRLGNIKIATDKALRMHTYFYKDVASHQAFPMDSFYDVLTGKIPPEKYRNKIVLIGSTAAGIGSPQVTPVSSEMAPVVTLANSVSSILQGDFFVNPSWAGEASAGAFLLVALYLILLLPRVSAAMGAGLTALLMTALLMTHFILMMTRAIWLPLMLPVSLLLVGHLVLTTKHYLLTERGKKKSDAESAESNKMLGMTFQGQGNLDMAFDKFRRVPLGDSMMGVLYSLGLDFERKRQFNKAEMVFQYMSGHNSKFKDLPDRIVQNRLAAGTVVLPAVAAGRGSGGIGGASALNKPGVSKSMLGRYEIEKEIGRGAMGAIYLGKDSKIGRVVAIKTMALKQEFGPEEVEDVRARFFREAESVGRLNHRNIVTVYDAGEEHDLAYIAMEFLKGKDLIAHTKSGNRLPLPKVLDICARVADALDYAHQKNVVHRDIKPGNIMYDPETDSVKVTDFGIARITDSSKTKTGMILGTPSFMSPEQLSGKKIGGSSDLFSLGVCLFQLASGTLPFNAESIAPLMYKIATTPHPNILELRPDLPPCVRDILDRALAKKVEDRYATGSEMAAALRRCALQSQQ